MSGYETDEEQLEALKKWWAENGKAVLVGVVLGLGAIFGWRGWISHEQGRSEAASALYEEVINAIEAPHLIHIEAVTVDKGSSMGVGELVFRKQCSGCHMVGPDAKHRVGPHLNGIFGRKAGTRPSARCAGPWKTAATSTSLMWPACGWPGFCMP